MHNVVVKLVFFFIIAVSSISLIVLPESKHCLTVNDEDLVLEIRCDKKKIKVGDKTPCNIDAYIINKSKRSFNVVQPGDGSISGKRTPRVKWSVRLIESKLPLTQDYYDYFKHPDGFPSKFDAFSGCGTFNPVKRSDIVNLQPDKSVRLLRTGQPSNALNNKVGKYGVKFYYENLPDFEWKFIHPSPDVLEIIKTKTPKVQLESNELIFEVIE